VIGVMSSPTSGDDVEAAIARAINAEVQAQGAGWGAVWRSWLASFGRDASPAKVS
jgi:hypothetical protein